MGKIERVGLASSAGALLLAAVRASLEGMPPMPAKDLAQRVGVSLRTLQRRLRLLGTSYQQEAADARLRVAKKLMRDTSHSIKWIALESGCASLQNFSTFFRDSMGVSPSQWRSEERAEPTHGLDHQQPEPGGAILEPGGAISEPIGVIE
jgi:transcriptional regulator GlxA family with amidase domain